MLLRRILASAAVLTALVGAASAVAADAPAGTDPVCAPMTAATAWPFAANTNRVGRIDLRFFSAPDVPVTYYECVEGRAQPLGVRTAPGAPITSLLSAVPWSCDRLARHFAGTATLSSGEQVRGVTSTRTPSCAHRLGLTVPRRVKPGALVRLRIADRWHVGGVHARLCVRPPRGPARCRTVAFPAGSTAQTRRVRVARRGTWRVDVQLRRFHLRTAIGVGTAPAKVHALLPLLATGDSTMQGVDSALQDDVGAEYDVVSDVHPGYSISRVDWLPIARAQVAKTRPQVVVMSMGAAEGFPMTPPGGVEHACCDAAWAAEYVRRQRQIMRTYAQGGRARAFYLTIAAPRGSERAQVVDVVNRGIIDAARGIKGVHVLRMDLLFSPNGYQPTIRDGGRDVGVREPDGIHLNAAGTAIEARETAKVIQQQPSLIPPG